MKKILCLALYTVVGIFTAYNSFCSNEKSAPLIPHLDAATVDTIIKTAWHDYQKSSQVAPKGLDLRVQSEVIFHAHTTTSRYSSQYDRIR